MDVREQTRVGGRAVWQLLLSRTEFGAGDEGELVATSRAGNRLVLRVSATDVGDGGAVWHTVDKPLAVDTTVEGRVLEREGESEEAE